MVTFAGLKKIIGAVVPSRMIATFFWIGYLPEWQSHWAAFFTIPLALLVIYFTVGFTASVFLITKVLLIFSCVLLVLGIIGIYIFQKTVFSENRYEVTIHVAFGQCLMLALCVPAINQTAIQLFLFNSFICDHFLNCASWFLNYSTYFITALVPYFIFRLMDMVKPWPSYWIERDYHNAFSNMIEGFFNSIYASVVFYMLNFMLFNLFLVDVVDFYRQVFSDFLGNGGLLQVHL